ncbi:MAG: transcriptional repressor [Lachnospiraceae bacterium]|nr:transcriptional repressor [Lachnospiraceae bacterium]
MALKYSRQREVIKENLMHREDHPTADMVYMDVRETFPNISLGTVYRNLQLLTDLGEIQKLNVGDGVDHFDAKTFPHYHFICSECGSVIDLQMDNIDTIKDIAGVNFDGQIAGHITYFYGVCGNCCKKTSGLQPGVSPV